MARKHPATRRAPTIGDVARSAGVSVATVSHVLNRTQKFVSEDARARVERAARELGYRPNYVARALKTRVTRAIGVVVRDVHDSLSLALLNGLADATTTSGAGLLLAASDSNWGAEQRQVHDLLGRQVDGLVVMPSGREVEHLREVVARGVPLVVLDDAVDLPGVLSLLPDVADGVRQALDHLWSLGHRRIAFVAGATASFGRTEAFGAYRAFCAAHEVDAPSSYVRTNASSTVGGYKAVQSLLQLVEPPSAVVVADRWMTLGAFRAVLVSGRRWPDDLALVGMGDTDWAEAIPPGLTVVGLPTYELGHEAGLRLLSAIDGGPIASGTARLATRLVVRGSTRTGG